MIITMCELNCPTCNAPVPETSSLAKGLRENEVARLGAKLAVLRSLPGKSEARELQIAALVRELAVFDATIDSDGFVVSR